MVCIDRERGKRDRRAGGGVIDFEKARRRRRSCPVTYRVGSAPLSKIERERERESEKRISGDFLEPYKLKSSS